jgi:hypothetical protein
MPQEMNLRKVEMPMLQQQLLDPGVDFAIPRVAYSMFGVVCSGFRDRLVSLADQLAAQCGDGLKPFFPTR